MPVIAVDAAQRVHHAGGVAGVKAGDGLISQHDAGVLHKRPGNRHTLLLAARQGACALQRLRGQFQRSSARMAIVRSASVKRIAIEDRKL